MTNHHPESRRSFLTAAGAVAALPAISQCAFARTSDQVRLGLIGVGIRGYELHRDLVQSPHARVTAICDLSDHYLERISPELSDPRTAIHRDYRALLDDKDVDAVIIATPDHWHARMTLDALDAGKHVFVEKPLSYSLEEAGQVKAKAKATGLVTQVGYWRRSMTHVQEAKKLVQLGILGDITHIQLWSSRNRSSAPWRTYDNYNKEGLPLKSGAEHVDWERFQANRPARPYDPLRFFHWQCYEEYSTGIFGILMSHYLDAANLVMDLDIPASCAAAGGIFKYEDGRTTPDTCSALFTYPSQRLSISFIGMSTNSFNDQEGHYRGTQGTLELRTSSLSVYAEARNSLFEKFAVANQFSKDTDLRTNPVHTVRSQGPGATRAHLDDFFVNIKAQGRCNCPIEDAYKTMVGVAMAIEAYKSQCTVRWDNQQQQIVRS